MSSDTSFEDFAASAVPRLRRLGYAVSHDWHRADDLVQETLQRVYAAWPRLRRGGDDPDGGPYGYARTVLVRRFISEQRQPWRRHEHSVAFGVDTDLHDTGINNSGINNSGSDDAEDDGSSDQARRRPAGDTLGAVDSVGQRLDLLAALAALPPRQRAIAVLRYVEELSVEETAEVLGCRAGTVKSQAHHARRALRARLLDDLVGEVATTEAPLHHRRGPR